MVELNNEVILSALRSVMDPERGKDLVTLNMIRDIKIQGGSVSFTIVLTTPASPLQSQIEANAKNAVLSIPGVKLVAVKMSADVPADEKLKTATPSPIKQSIAVASGKGGVGKSTVAVNLAIALAKAGAKVGLLDADIYGPNVPTMMGITQLPVPIDGKLEPAVAYGVKVMSIGYRVSGTSRSGTYLARTDASLCHQAIHFRCKLGRVRLPCDRFAPWHWGCST